MTFKFVLVILLSSTWLVTMVTEVEKEPSSERASEWEKRLQETSICFSNQISSKKTAREWKNWLQETSICFSSQSSSKKTEVEKEKCHARTSQVVHYHRMENTKIECWWCWGKKPWTTDCKIQIYIEGGTNSEREQFTFWCHTGEFVY